MVSNWKNLEVICQHLISQMTKYFWNLWLVVWQFPNCNCRSSWGQFERIARGRSQRYSQTPEIVQKTPKTSSQSRAPGKMILNSRFSSSSISLFSLSLSLRERESWHYNHSVPHHPPTENFLRTLELTYTQVWYIIGIVSSSPTHFHSEKIGLIRVTYDLPCQH